MEYNEMAAKRRKKLKTYAFMRLLRLFAAILFPHSVAYAAASSSKRGEGNIHQRVVAVPRSARARWQRRVCSPDIPVRLLQAIFPWRTGMSALLTGRLG